MKELIFPTLFLAAVLCFLATSFNVTWKPFKISIESFHWGYALGSFLIIMGVVICVVYAKHQEHIKNGYYEGYEAGIKDHIEYLKEYNNMEVKHHSIQ